MFTATKWATVADKEAFVKAFKRFVHSGFKQTLLTKKMYTRMSMMREHIAHYNQLGFWENWFETAAQRAAFLDRWTRGSIYGDPAFTWSDVERELSLWLREHPEYLRRELQADADATEIAERAELARLKAKYEVVDAQSAAMA